MRILHENTDEAQDRNDLEGIQEDCLAWWNDLNAGSKLEKIIAQHNAREKGQAA